MRLGGMHQERVAEIDRSGFAGRHGLGQLRGARKVHGDELAQRETGLAGRRQCAGDREMRSDADAGRRVVGTDIREQEQHQQRTAA
jgi:hypothetical protein